MPRPVPAATTIAEVKTPAPPAPTTPAAGPPATPAAPIPQGPDPASHPLVRQAIELFKARVVDIQPKRD